ncbi:uncharacterized protein LOC126850205 [Cataglyphis hispanica]|uniref:uncharacterized protein LOC126850205 n=1 Tax=Cataglyphis hispanica TaxID=1086592 RepID=UPI00217FDCD9|nr:uncharacterized protein LOC126850205 [Cataglyphis hispanica]
MARQINHVILIGTLLASAYVIEGASIASWVNDFTSNLNRNLNNMIQQINAQVAYLTDDIQKNIENFPRDAEGNLITNSSSISSIITNNGKIVTIIDGVSTTITSGRTANGEPYIHEVVEKRIGDMLYHNETTTNPETGATKTIAWKLNLAIPGSKPEIITKKNEK